MRFTFSCFANCQLQTLMRIMAGHSLAPGEQLHILQAICQYVGDLPEGLNPGYVYSKVFDLFIQKTGIKDPCAIMRKKQNQQGKAVRSIVRTILNQSNDRLLKSMKAAAAGNLIDISFGDSFDLEKEIVCQIEGSFSVDDTKLFYDLLKNAENMSLLTDNAGEIVIDKLLIDEIQRWRMQNGYKPIRVTSLVKARPILNDALDADAQDAGLYTVGEVYDTGCSYIGTPFEYVSDFTREKLETADMIIAKGLANFESLYSQKNLQKKIFYLFKSKCSLISEMLGVPINSIVCMNGQNIKNTI